MVLFICICDLSADKVKTVNLGNHIDYITIYPHFVLFTNGLQYMKNSKMYKIQRDDEVITISGVRDLSLVTDKIQEEDDDGDGEQQIWIRFDSRLQPCIISQLIENITRTIVCKKKPLR
ncbi:hypothetical protein PvNV_082 [Penaeus vannamei nudivirus]|nr:hypothetical protein PvSNPV_082 [Penaeus vannamei nucleopolyhedrovirus]